MTFGQPDTPAANAEIGAAERGLVTTLKEPGPDIPRVSWVFILVFTLMTLGANIVILMPTLFTIAFKVQLIAPQQKEAALGLVVGIGAIVTIVMSPIFGQLADHTRLKWGRRRPWILFGILLCAVGGVSLALAPNIPLVIASFIVYIAGTAAIMSCVSPVVADQIPESQRGKVGGLAGVAAQLGGVAGVLIGSMLTGNILLLVLLPVIIVAVLFMFYVFVVADAPAPSTTPRESLFDVFRKMVFNPRRHPDVAWVWLGRFLLFGGINFFSTYQLYFLLDRLGLTPAEAGQRLALVGGLGVLVASAFAVVGGILSDRLHRRKLFVYLGIVMVAAGLLLAAFAHDFWAYAIASLVLVGGAGVFGSVDIAMASEVVPDRSAAGRWMGIIGVSGYVPTAIAPLVAPLILSIGGGSNYLALFVFGAVITAGAAITTWRVRSVR